MKEWVFTPNRGHIYSIYDYWIWLKYYFGLDLRISYQSQVTSSQKQKQSSRVKSVIMRKSRFCANASHIKISAFLVASQVKSSQVIFHSWQDKSSRFWLDLPISATHCRKCEDECRSSPSLFSIVRLVHLSVKEERNREEEKRTKLLSTVGVKKWSMINVQSEMKSSLRGPNDISVWSAVMMKNNNRCSEIHIDGIYSLRIDLDRLALSSGSERLSSSTPRNSFRGDLRRFVVTLRADRFFTVLFGKEKNVHICWSESISVNKWAWCLWKWYGSLCDATKKELVLFLSLPPSWRVFLMIGKEQKPKERRRCDLFQDKTGRLTEKEQGLINILHLFDREDIDRSYSQEQQRPRATWRENGRRGTPATALTTWLFCCSGTCVNWTGEEGPKESRSRAKTPRSARYSGKETKTSGSSRRFSSYAPLDLDRLVSVYEKMATENLKNAAEQRDAAKAKYIEERLRTISDDFNGLNEVHLVSLVKELHKKLAETEESQYDLQKKNSKTRWLCNVLPPPPADVFFSPLSSRRYRLDRRIDDQSKRSQRKISWTNFEESLENNAKVRDRERGRRWKKVESLSLFV